MFIILLLFNGNPSADGELAIIMLLYLKELIVMARFMTFIFKNIRKHFFPLNFHARNCFNHDILKQPQINVFLCVHHPFYAVRFFML